MTGLLTACLLVLGGSAAVFSSTSANPASTLAADTLDAYLPSAVTGSRTGTTTCLVSWTPISAPPAGLTYDVTDGAGNTVATSVSGVATSVTVPTSAVSPTVRARRGTWVSASARTSTTPCTGWPDAPGSLTVTPSEGTVVSSWAAPAGNGGTVASYTAVISPAPASGSATCAVTAPAASCSWSSLTNGLTYTVSVTATSNIGTGPAATATAVPYPSSVMTPSALKLWLDGADSTTLLASSTCTGAAATTTVGCWKDKSSGASDATQATAGVRPTLSSVSGRSVPSFNGTTQNLTLSAGLLPTGTSSSTILAAGVLTDTTPNSSPHRMLFTYGTAGTAQARGLWKGWYDNAVFASTWSSGSTVQSTWRTSATTVAAASFDAGIVSLWAHGAVTAATTSQVFATGTTIGVVGSFNGNYYWQGQVPEVIVMDRLLSQTDRRAIEEYLSRKWSGAITPGAPTSVNGAATTAASTSATVTWTAPAYDGGTAVTSYTTTAVPAAGGATVTCTATAPSTSCTLTGLAGGGARYSVTVAATNGVGQGPPSGAATVFSGVPSGANVKLWLAADDLDGNGVQAGAAESGLVSGAVQTWKDKSGAARDVTAPSPAARPAYGTYTINGYTVPSFNGTTVLQGTGTNPYGITGDRSLFVVTRERTVDTATTFLVDRVPEDNQIFSLMVCSSNWALQHRNDAGTGLGCVSGGASPSANRVDVVAAQRTGTTNSARVSASPGATATLTGPITQNAVSIGRHASYTGSFNDDITEVLLYDTYLSSGQRRAVETYLAAKWGGALAPDVPTAVSAAPTGSSGQLAVSWTAPSDIGGSAPTLYTARTSSGGFSCTATPPATSCTLTGLTDGTAYTVTVTATNTTGTGDPSTSTTGTPATVPGAPTAVAATAGDTTSSVSWTAPSSNGGSAITSYTATAVPSDGALPTRTCTSSTSPCTLTSLTNGITYTVTVTATNAIGTGAASSSTTAIPYPSAIMSASALRIWLDGADTTRMFTTSSCMTSVSAVGQSIGCWKDKSGQGNDVTQATAGNQPVAATVAGRLVPSFDGSNDALDRSSTTLPTGTGDSTTFVVATNTTATPGSAGLQLLTAAGTTSTGLARLLFKDASSAQISTNANFTTNVNDGTIMSGTPFAASSTFTANTYTLRANGRPSQSFGYTYNTTSSYLTISYTGSAWKGPISEVLVTNNALSAADQRTVLEYLARKWSVTITPAAPGSLVATPSGGGSVSLTWAAPNWDGGAAVSPYTVTSSSGGSCAVSGLTATCTGVPTGTRTFTVTATNSIGTGPSTTTTVTVT